VVYHDEPNDRCLSMITLVLMSKITLFEAKENNTHNDGGEC